MATATRFSKQEFRQRFSRLQAKHRRLVMDAMGNPPDHRNVPKYLWEQIEKEEAAAYLILMTGIGLQSLQIHSRGVERKTNGAVTQVELRQELQRQNIKRARWAARQTTATVRRKLQQIIEKLPEPKPTPRPEPAKTPAGKPAAEQRPVQKPKPAVKPEEIVDRIWTPSRRDRIIDNESVAATTNGASTVVEVAKKKKLEVFHIWRLGTCQHCEVCPLLDRTDESYWGDVTSGPPLHVNCCCMTVVAFGTREELVQQGKLLARFPSEAELLAAIRRSGWKL